jgi:hypothetical protein
MAKFSGTIGYAQSVETAPGVWTDQVSERRYFGDVIRESRQNTNSGNLNDNIVVNNRVSVVADDFANENFSTMKYIVWYGVYWEITSVEVQRPRLILSLGGVYNGPKA